MSERYIIERKLGEGASASVLLATDTRTNQLVAIKTAHDVMARHARFAGRWQREVIVLQTLQHPRIVPLLDATFTQGKKLTMVMPFAAKGSLEDKLLKGCTLKNALKWMLETLEGLAYIHSFDIIHQDVKPDNVLISEEGSAWLADFSVARTRAELLTNSQDVTGTPEWYAPEQRMRLASEVGPWSDLYAWGKMLGQILSSVSYRSGELNNIVEGCTVIDPQQRFRSSSELLVLMEEAIETLPNAILQRRFKWKYQRTHQPLLKDGFTCAPDVVPVARKGKCRQTVRPKWNQGTTFSPTLLSVVARYRSRPEALRQLFDMAEWVQQNQRSKVVFIKGERGIGKKDVIRQFVQRMQADGVMDSLILSYHQNGAFDDGYRGAVQHLLSPWGEEREDFIERLQRWLAREKQIPIKSARREATGLAKWCGFLESNEQAVDNGLGLVFLFQHLQSLSWKGGAVLVLEDPEFCTVNGDGLDICETLLSDVFSNRPVLVLATLSDNLVQERPLVKHKIGILERMGAEILEIAPWSDDEIVNHIEAVCHLPEQHRASVLEFCTGHISKANLFVQSVALGGGLTWSKKLRKFKVLEGFEPYLGADFFDIHFQQLHDRLPQPLLALDILAVMAHSSEPVEQLLLNEISSTGLQELIQVGLLIQQERSIRFAHAGLKEAVLKWSRNKISEVVVHQKIAEAWMELVERWGLRLDLQIGQAWFSAGQPNKALPFLLLALQDARNSWLWERTEQIADLIEVAAEQGGSRVGLLEGRLNRLEVRLKQHSGHGIVEWIQKVKDMSGLDPQSRGRLCLIEAEFLMHRTQWVQANGLLKEALDCFTGQTDRRGRAKAFMQQGYLLLTLNRLEGAADRFAQACGISPKSSLEWVESQTRLIEVRLRLGWTQGLPKQIDGLWRITQNNADIHHMAHATYVAGLLLVHQLRIDEALVRLQTTHALTASCGDAQLRAQSMEYQGAAYFLSGRWAEARENQKGLLFHYQLRHHRDRRRVAMLRLRCAYALDPAVPNVAIWKVEMQNLEQSFVHVQYWWWMLHLLNPANTPSQIEAYWQNAKKVSEPRIWDIALYAVLESLMHHQRYRVIQTEVQSEIKTRYPVHHKTFAQLKERQDKV